MGKNIFACLTAALLLAGGTAQAQAGPRKPRRLPKRPPAPVRPGVGKALRPEAQGSGAERPESPGKPGRDRRGTQLSRHQILLQSHPEWAQRHGIGRGPKGRLLRLRSKENAPQAEAGRKKKEGERPGTDPKMKERLNRLGRGRVGPAETRPERLRRTFQESRKDPNLRNPKENGSAQGKGNRPSQGGPANPSPQGKPRGLRGRGRRPARPGVRPRPGSTPPCPFRTRR